MTICTRCWLRNCLEDLARKTPRLTVSWFTISTPLPAGPGIAIIVNYFGPLRATPRGNIYILIFTKRFSHRPDTLFAVATAEFTAEGTADVLVNRFIPLWRRPRSIL